MSSSRMRKKATLKDVAEIAGVSPITVSRFVNTPDLVSSSAREKIVRAIEESGYIPNAAARQLKTSQSDIVFFLVPNIRNELYSTLSHELMLKLSAMNKSLFICDYNFQDKLEQMLMHEIYKHRPAAIVMAAGDGMEDAQLQLLNTSKIPVIQFDRINDKITSIATVELDNYRGGQLAAGYLLEKQVNKAVLFAGNTKRVMTARKDGFIAECRKAGVDVECVEVDMYHQSPEVFNLTDAVDDTGYFLLNSDIANRFLLTNIGKLSQHTAERIVTFDHVTNGEFLPYPVASIHYDYSLFVETIYDCLVQLFTTETVPGNRVTIPVVLG